MPHSYYSSEERRQYDKQYREQNRDLISRKRKEAYYAEQCYAQALARKRMKRYRKRKKQEREEQKKALRAKILCAERGE